MNLIRTGRFRKDFKKLDRAMQDRAIETLAQYEADPKHPSLHTKLMGGTDNIREMRVTDNFRITFQVDAGDVILRRVGSHDRLRHP